MKKFLLSFILVLTSAIAAMANGHIVTISSTPVTCTGDASGTAIASVSGGTGPFSYSWSPGGQITQVVTALTAGTYIVTVTDGNDLSTATASVTITEPAQKLTVTSNSITVCAGLCGNLLSTAIGGTPVYTYSWSPGAATTSSPNFCPIATTTYSVIVTDNNGCSASSSASITVNPSPVITVPSATICAGNTVALTASGASAYIWSPATGLSNTTTGTVFSNPTTTTTYTVIGTNGGCSGSAITVVTVNQNPTPTIIGSTLVCPGGNTILTATGGNTYTWSNGNTGNSISVSPAATTTYTVTTTTVNGCTGSTTVAVTVAPTCNLVVTATSATVCTGTCETITATGNGGTWPYTYVWSPGGETTYQISTCPVSTTTYTVTVTDAASNTATATSVVSVVSATPPTIVLDTIINIHCSGNKYGKIAIHITGGSPPFQYLWNNGSTTDTLTTFYGGLYTITVTDVNGCRASGSYTLKSSANMYASITSNPANCANDGTATVNPIGGQTPYTYLWTPSNQTTATANNLSVGYYSVLITDSAGCQTSGLVYIYSSNCSNIIKGRLYNDVNQNCIQDPGETGIAGKYVYATPGYYYGYTDVNGDYTILTQNMNNTVNANYYYNYSCSNISLTCPASGNLTVNFTSSGDTSLANNFGYYANANAFDLDIHPGWTSATPGFEKKYWFLYVHNSPIARNVTVRFIYDPVLQYKSCTQGGVHYPAQHKIEWTFNNLAPGMYWDWATKPEIFFDVPATLSITSTLHSYFEILPIAGDCNPSNNTLDVTEPVTGSHDPNSKAVIPEGQGPNGNILKNDSVLFYNIHFQNNGNDTAYTVVVQDTLSSFLDPGSVIPGAASHPYTFNLSGHGILTFRFDHIMLPDSTTDEPGSNGYFNYTVKVKPNAAIGSVIKNTASIYFDFNSAIVTNTTVNTIVSTIGIEELSNSNSIVKVYPNPFSDNTTFVIQSDKLNETYSFELTDILGKQVRLIKEITGKEFQISRNGLPNGIYFYKIHSAESIVGIGKLVIK